MHNFFMIYYANYTEIYDKFEFSGGNYGIR